MEEFRQQLQARMLSLRTGRLALFAHASGTVSEAVKSRGGHAAFLVPAPEAGWRWWEAVRAYRNAPRRRLKTSRCETFIGSCGVERMVGVVGKVVKWHEQSTAQRVLNAEIAWKVCRALERAVSRDGICRDGMVDSVGVAGMSGRASMHFELRLRFVICGRSFAGFYPVKNPIYVVVVTFVTGKDNPVARGGGRGARAFAEIAKRILANE